MYNFEIVLALLVGVALLALLARRLTVPTPAILVAGGLLVALLPGLPAVRFDPQLVFLVFIPPLLYRASLDRKSTRLNSSHSQISYAVFCLKKKKKDKGLTARPQVNAR